MSRRGRIAAVLATAAVALTVVATASAHAYLVKTVPSASVVLTAPPSNVSLTFDEAVEPRFATISVTDAEAHQQTTGPPTRSPTNPDTLVVPLKPHLPEGWYLVYWRAISIDGHPVQGAFTFAVGPNQGPAPQFVVPKLSATATTPRLLIARWAMFLTVMTAIGLFTLRIAIVRPVARRVEGSSLRAVSIAFVVASILGLIAIPVYLDVATSVDSLRSMFAVGALVPLFRVTAFGRSYVDLELCFALFAAAAWIAIWVDRPRDSAALDRRARRDDRGVPGRRRRRADSRGGRPCGADSAARVVAAPRLAPRRICIGLDGWPDRIAGPVAKPRAVDASGRSQRCRSALLQRCVRLGDGPARQRDRGDDHPHADDRLALADVVRAGDSRQGGTALSRDARRRRQPLDHDAASQGGAARPGARQLGGAPVASHRPRRDPAGRLRTVRRRRPLEPRSAGGGPGQGRLGARARRSRVASRRPCTRTATRCRCSSRPTRP